MGLGTVLFLSAAADGRIFGLDQQTVIQITAQLFNFILLSVLLTYILYKPVRNFMRKRTDKIKGQLMAAEEDMAAANELKQKYEKLLMEIEQERLQILEAAHKAAADKSRLLLDDAGREAEAARERASMEIQRERERIKEEIRLYIIEVSTVMAGKIVAHAMDKDTQNRLFDETIAELEAMAWRN